MIRSLVDYALNNRFIVLSIAFLLFVWGIISFEKLPVEAYPDVANTWVQVITQRPGRAVAEEARAASHRADRNPNEWHPAFAACSFCFVSWSIGRQSDL